MNIASALGGYALAAIVLGMSLGFVRWSLRTIDRKDKIIDALRVDSLNRLAHVAGKPYDLTPAEKHVAHENARDRARRQMMNARIVENPENAMEYPAASEALQALEDIAADTLAELSDEERRPLLVDVAGADVR